MHAQRYKLVMVSDDGKRHLRSEYDPQWSGGMTFPEATTAYQRAVRDNAIAENALRMSPLGVTYRVVSV